jgi:hypothetical protein
METAVDGDRFIAQRVQKDSADRHGEQAVAVAVAVAWRLR